MTLLSFFRLLLRFKWLIMLTPLVSACLIYFLVSGRSDTFESKSVVYTGLVSGFNLESGSGVRLDYHVVSSGFDNLINTIQARETLLDAAIELMSRVTCAGSYPQFENEAWRIELIHYVRKLTGTSSCESHRAVIRNNAFIVDTAIYRLLFKSVTPLSLSALLSNLSVRRVSASDLIELKFSASDPQLAQDMLVVLNASFIRRYQKIKRREVGSVVEFFEAETARSYERLQLAVDRMRVFGTDNRIINFYEQTKAIASQKELIDQQIQNEEMNLQSAESAERDLELRIGTTTTIRTHGVALVEIRQRLANLTAEQALKSVSRVPTTGTDLLLTNLGSELEQVVEDLYRARYSKEGLIKSELVKRWLDQMVKIAQSRAALEVLRTRKTEYVKVYDQFAPMGSTLNTLEREVDIAEREYLELLHSLNQARMRQQNIELSSSMDVLDRPSFPHDPVPSKMFVLLMAGCLAAGMLSIGIALAIEFLDQSLRSPESARARTGMELIGFLPDDDEDLNDGELFETTERCLEQMTARLLTLLSIEPENRVRLVCVGSGTEGTGKSHLIEKLGKFLEATGRTVVRLSADETVASTELTAVDFTDRVPHSESGDEINSEYHPNHVWPIVLKEIRAFAKMELPVGDLKKASCVLWVARADSLWTGPESNALDFIQEHLGITPLLCLNKVRSERMETELGGIFKQRSKQRRNVKKVLQRNFS